MSERPRYFQGQVLGVQDLEQEQLYHREKARRHNREVHGWGIVRGLHVESGRPRKAEVKISPGYALDRRGEEIVVNAGVTVDLSGHPAGSTVYVALRYDERPERPVPVPGPRGKEYSRIRETFAVEVLTRLPRQKPLVIVGDVELGPGGKIARIAATHRREIRR